MEKIFRVRQNCNFFFRVCVCEYLAISINMKSYLFEYSLKFFPVSKPSALIFKRYSVVLLSAYSLLAFRKCIGISIIHEYLVSNCTLKSNLSL